MLNTALLSLLMGLRVGPYTPVLSNRAGAWLGASEDVLSLISPRSKVGIDLGATCEPVDINDFTGQFDSAHNKIYREHTIFLPSYFTAVEVSITAHTSAAFGVKYNAITHGDPYFALHFRFSGKWRAK